MSIGHLFSKEAVEPDFPKWKARRVFPREQIVIKSIGDIPSWGKTYNKTIRGRNVLVWDLEQKHILDFSKIGECSQKESAPHGISVRMDDFMIRNAWIEFSPNGIESKAFLTILWNCVVNEVCEDAVNFKEGADYGIIYRCNFGRAQDKCVQINDCYNVWVAENNFRKADTAVKALRSQLYCYGNEFYNPRQVYVADGSSAKITYDDKTERYANIRQRKTSKENGGSISNKKLDKLKL